MKKSIFSLVGLVAFAAAFTSCKKIVLDAGPLTEEVRDIDEEFTEIEISGSIDLLINQEDSDDLVRIEVGENLLEHIETFVQSGTLFIDLEANNISSRGIKKAYVNQSFIDKITMNGSGDLEADELITSEFELKMKGSGDADIKFDEVASLEISMDGSGDCKVDGVSESLDLAILGSGDCNARLFEVNEAIVNVNGSGDVEVFSSQELLVNINGSGDVDYWGEPEITDFNVNGSGDITAH
jgi:hypothetical protein